MHFCTLSYDGTFSGLLSAVFYFFEQKLPGACIGKMGEVDLFAHYVEVISDDEKARRVWDGLAGRLSTEGMHNLYACFLSEQKGIENIILEFCRHVFNSRESVETDFGHKETLAISQIARKVFREKHRMEAFVRFARTADDIYFSLIEPECNVLPLIRSHFAKRYADQDWIIYDKKRAYGIHFNSSTKDVAEIILDFTGDPSKRSPETFHAEERLYQQLWKDYFQHVNIPSRKNLKLHIRHVPTRYWKHLTEKNQL